MAPDISEINLLILVPCEQPNFKDKYADCIKLWLTKVSEQHPQKPSLKFTAINILDKGIPPMSLIETYDGIIITGSFSSIGQDKPWMKTLRHILRHCYMKQLPIFAICFGFQIISHAFGCSYLVAPYGFNFSVSDLKFEAKALPFFKPFLENLQSDKKSQREPYMNGNHLNNNHANHDHDKSNSIITVFSHNDVITSLPNIDNIDFGDVSEHDRNEMSKSLSEMVSIIISTSEKAPITGFLIGNKKKIFIIAVQNHPESDTFLGQDFFKQVLDLKLSQGIITLEKLKNCTEQFKDSNSGYVYGMLALSLFIEGHITPKY